jgi:hypothetical protein
MDSPIDDAIAEAKAQAARLPAIIPARRLRKPCRTIARLA